MTLLSEAVGALAGKAELSDADALQLRTAIYGSTITVTRAEVEALFALNAQAKTLSTGWRQLFIEAATDLVVRQGQPPGYVDDQTAGWLVALVKAHDIKGDEIELLLHVLEEADGTPASFSTYVLDVVKRFALWSLQRCGRMDGKAVETLRRAVFAKGGEDNVGVTREEAQALLEVNAAARGLAADPAWKDFFVRAVAASVLSAPVWHADAAREAQEQSWLADPKQLLVFPWSPRDAYTEKLVEAGEHDLAESLREGLADFAHGHFRDLRQDEGRFGETLFDEPIAEERRAEAADEATLASADVLSDEKADWLLARIGAAGPVDENERALVDFILANAASASPKLKAGLQALQQQAA